MDEFILCLDVQIKKTGKVEVKLEGKLQQHRTSPTFHVLKHFPPENQSKSKLKIQISIN